MNSKITLFIGIFFLIAGILLKKTTELFFLAIALMVIGVLLKTFYIVAKAKSGAYKPGYELGFVFVGLLLLFSAIYFREELSKFYYAFLIGSGIGLKIAFVILFIIQVKTWEKKQKML